MLLTINLTYHLRKEAAQRDPLLRAQWMLQLADWTAEQLIIIDERGRIAGDAERGNGWGKRCQRIRVVTCQRSWSAGEHLCIICYYP
jgi:hypothetical protein